ncbi:MAG: hypothetical protein RJA70_1510 [Pseudomonadota bacterium]|jgi:4'-phosphopantetheinyl transferase EntD
MLVEEVGGVLGSEAKVVTVELRDVDLVGLERGLTRAELTLVAGAIETRRREFAAGRLLARHALARMGHANCEVLCGSGREPLWPPGVSGSISHCETRAIVAVASAASGSIGIDIEGRRQLPRELWDKVLLPGEIEALRASHRELERGRRALLCFSIKEALYKAQYPLSRQYLGFHAVAVTFEGDPSAECGHVVCTFQLDVGPFRRGQRVRGRFWLDAFQGGETLAVVVAGGRSPNGVLRR